MKLALEIDDRKIDPTWSKAELESLQKDLQQLVSVLTQQPQGHIVTIVEDGSRPSVQYWPSTPKKRSLKEEVVAPPLSPEATARIEAREKAKLQALLDGKELPPPDISDEEWELIMRMSNR